MRRMSRAAAVPVPLDDPAHPPGAVEERDQELTLVAVDEASARWRCRDEGRLIRRQQAAALSCGIGAGRHGSLGLPAVLTYCHGDCLLGRPGVDRGWTASRENPSAMRAFLALARGIVAGQVRAAGERASRNASLGVSRLVSRGVAELRHS